MKRFPVRRGFTLVELLVVISIIALLIGILLPALGRARDASQRAVILANMRAIGQAVSTYNAENSDMMPNSYLYADRQDPESTPRSIQFGSANGSTKPYVHWSHRLFDGDAAPPEAFTSPAVANGGAPRTNPGKNIADWEDGQVDNAGTPATNPDVYDYQAPRIAYGGNDVIFPRNKLVDTGTGRVNIPVNIARVAEPTSKLILAAEYHYSETQGWRCLRRNEGASGDGGVWKSVSHRPITPFLGISSGVAVTEEPNSVGGGGFARFLYPNSNNASVIFREGSPLFDTTALLDNDVSLLNAVSRMHQGKGHFVFVDGHVAPHTVKETIKKRLWGTRFYSLSGDNRVSDEFVFGGVRFEELDDQ